MSQNMILRMMNRWMWTDTVTDFMGDKISQHELIIKSRGIADNFEVLKVIKQKNCNHVESEFPSKCTKCGYETLRQIDYS